MFSRPHDPGSTPSLFSSGAAPGLAASVVALLALSACAGSEAGMEWAGTVTDSAGIQIIHNPAQGTWSPGEAWTFQEELRIGTLQGAPELQFGAIIGMDVDLGGNIYVLDQQAQEVRVFSPGGDHQRTVGAPGQGPGELSPQTQAVFASDDGTVQVVDLGNQRVTTYGPDGAHAGEFRVDFTGGIPIRWERNASGQLVAQLRGMNVEGMEAHKAGDPIITYAEDGSLGDTLHLLPKGESMEITQGQLPKIRLFETEPVWDLGPDMLLTAVNTDYRIEIRDMNGQVSRILTREMERSPVAESDRSIFLRALEETMKEQGTPPQAVEMMMGNISFAEFYPAFAQVLAGPLGTVMVQGIITADYLAEGDAEAEINIQDMGSSEWAVFDSEGRYMGVVTFPERFAPMKVAGDVIYGVWRDDLDVQWVLKLKVRMPAT